MRRAIAAVAGAAALLTAAPAQAAAPADPVKVLQQRLAKGTGVTFTESTSYVELSGKTTFLRRTGKLRLDRKGVAAADLNASYIDHRGGVFTNLGYRMGDERAIVVGKTVYLKGERWNPPAGKTWIKNSVPFLGLTSNYSQAINPAEPATLKALISGGRKSGSTYTGKISEHRLWKISPWFRLHSLVKPKQAATLKYELTLGPGKLPQKLVTGYPASHHWVKSLVGDDEISMETRYTRWGKVRVTVPPKSQVYESKR